jgi:LemA protein
MMTFAVSGGVIAVGIAVAGLLILGVWLIATYNGFVSVRQHLKESWADVDVELKRRYDLIPNVLNTVKGYAKHEKDLFESVTAARAKAMENTDRPDRQSGDERALSSRVNRLMAVAEAYPDLKASEHFLALQDELANTEDRIAAGRRFYNGNVRELNKLCREFPSNLLAGLFGFEEQGFFEVSDVTEREVVKVSMPS